MKKNIAIGFGLVCMLFSACTKAPSQRGTLKFKASFAGVQNQSSTPYNVVFINIVNSAGEVVAKKRVNNPVVGQEIAMEVPFGTGLKVVIYAFTNYVDGSSDYLSQSSTTNMAVVTSSPFSFVSGQNATVALVIDRTQETTVTVLPMMMKFTEADGTAISSAAISFRRSSNGIVLDAIGTTDSNGVVYTSLPTYPFTVDVLVNGAAIAAGLDFSQTSLTGNYYVVTRNAHAPTNSSTSIPMAVGLFARGASAVASTTPTTLETKVAAQTDPFSATNETIPGLSAKVDPPGAFAISSTSSSASGRIDVAWGASSNAKTYTVKYGTTSGTYDTTFSENATSPTAITGLTNGSTYYVRVYAKNPGGTTASTAEGSAIALPAPGAFTISSVVVASTTSVTITWSSSSNAASYTLKQGTSSGNYPTTISTSATSPTTVTGLTQDTTYYFMVTAVNATGNTNATSEGSGTPSAIPASPSAYYKLNETAGTTTLVDNTGNGNSLTVSGGVTMGGAGKPNGSSTSMLLNGSTGYAYATWPFSTDISSQINSGTVSYCAWVKPTSVAAVGEKGIMGVGNSGGPGGLNLAQNNQTIMFWFAATGSGYIISTDNVLTAGTWTHVCAVATSLSYISIYVNGAAVSVNQNFAPTGTTHGSSGLGSFTLTAVSNKFIVGEEGQLQAGRYFSGSIDEVGIWNRAITSGEVSILYNGQNRDYFGDFEREASISLERIFSSLFEMAPRRSFSFTGS